MCKECGIHQEWIELIEEKAMEYGMATNEGYSTRFAKASDDVLLAIHDAALSGAPKADRVNAFFRGLAAGKDDIT